MIAPIRTVASVPVRTLIGAAMSALSAPNETLAYPPPRSRSRATRVHTPTGGSVVSMCLVVTPPT